MQPYGKRKIKGSATHGHNECDICHPSHELNMKERARHEYVEEMQLQIDEMALEEMDRAARELEQKYQDQCDEDKIAYKFAREKE